jgi:hypothetical protein
MVGEKYLHNKIFNSISETMEIVSKSINDLNAKSDYVKPMTFFPYLNIIYYLLHNLV